MAEPGFLLANEHRAYPFTHASTLGAGPDYTDEVIVDCSMAVFASSSGVPAYCNSVARAGQVITVVLSVSATIITVAIDTGGKDYATIYFSELVSGVSCPPLVAVDGYVTLGRWRNLEKIPDNSQLDFSLLRLEPAQVQFVNGTIVNSISIANADRTRTTAAPGCSPLVFADAAVGVREVKTCMRGAIRIAPGINSSVRQDDFDQAIEIFADAGAGLPAACSEILAYPDEAPPTGRTTLDGAYRCEEVLRSINGVSKRLFDISAGKGATVVPDPDNHRLIVDVDMSQLSICLSPESIEELSNE